MQKLLQIFSFRSSHSTLRYQAGDFFHSHPLKITREQRVVFRFLSRQNSTVTRSNFLSSRLSESLRTRRAGIPIERITFPSGQRDKPTWIPLFRELQ